MTPDLCPKCGSVGAKTETTQWLIGWWPGDDGHKHNPNRRTTVYLCKNVHVWEHRYFLRCPLCDYARGGETVEQRPDGWLGFDGPDALRVTPPGGWNGIVSLRDA